MVFEHLHARLAGLGDLNTIDLRQTVADQANAQGVPPAIALAVAMQESGIQQYHADGSLVMGKAGEIGVMQLMPDTAAQLGVDATDPIQNIKGGVQLLGSLYSQFGSWPLALVAYNWGPGNLQKYLTSGRNPNTYQSVMQHYALPILARAGVGAAVDVGTTPAADQTDQGDPGNQTSNVPLILLGIVAAGFGVSWLME